MGSIRAVEAGRAVSRMLSPVIAVIGATGTGKSNLAVTLATHLDGEIINADAMQMYKGLPIITNKIPVEERAGVPHHLLDTIELEEQPWTVPDFKRRAQQLVGEIQSRGKRPIIVGGTLYYVQALLLRDSLCDLEDVSGDSRQSEKETSEDPILNAPTEEMLARLREVDPVMADRWHPNDHRKIRRSLQIYLQTGRSASQLYEAQLQHDQLSNPEADDGRPAYDSLVFWTYSPLDVLRPRLDNRVDEMMEAGLVDEVQSLYEFVKTAPEVDLTRGIGVSIGYKEFLPYLNAVQSGTATETIKEESVERTKISTRQYSRNQHRWIRRKLLPTFRDAGLLPRLFLLDATDPTLFAQNVEQPAVEVATRFFTNQTLPEPKSLSPVAREVLSELDSDTDGQLVDVSRTRAVWSRQTCQLCGITAVLEEEWKKHINGRKHRLVVKRTKARAENQARLAAKQVEEHGESQAV